MTCTEIAPSVGKAASVLGARQRLGIADKLLQILEEVKMSPTVVDPEEINFEFVVEVGAGGAVSSYIPSIGSSLVWVASAALLRHFRYS